MKLIEKAYLDQVKRVAIVRESKQSLAFEKGIRVLRVFVEREKKAHVPVMHVEPDLDAEKDYSLGRWVANQRVKYHRGKMRKEDVKILESIPDWN